MFSTCLVCWPLLVQADATATIFYLDSLLKQGKKVAILYMRMQEKEVTKFDFPEAFMKSLVEQMLLLEYFAQNDCVYFIDVNASKKGKTISETLEILKQKELYKLFIEDSFDVFERKPVHRTEFSADEIQTSLDEYLKSVGVNDVHITGCYDGVNIEMTADGALEHGYSVSVDWDMNVSDVGGPSRTALREYHERLWAELEKEYPDRLHRISKSPPGGCSE